MTTRKQLKSARRLTPEEFQKLRGTFDAHDKTISRIGALEMEKAILMDQAFSLRGEINAIEVEMKSKYGEDCVINFQTGEVTHKITKDA
jgi:hypothetical protein